MSLVWGPATAYPGPDHREFFSDLLCCKIFNLYNCDSLFYGGVPQTLPIGLLVEARLEAEMRVGDMPQMGGVRISFFAAFTNSLTTLSLESQTYRPDRHPIIT